MDFGEPSNNESSEQVANFSPTITSISSTTVTSTTQITTTTTSTTTTKEFFIARNKASSVLKEIRNPRSSWYHDETSSEERLVEKRAKEEAYAKYYYAFVWFQIYLFQNIHRLFLKLPNKLWNPFIESEGEWDARGLSVEEADEWGLMKLHNDYNWRKELPNYWTDEEPQPAYYYSEHYFPVWLKEIMRDVWEKEHLTTTSTTSTTTTTTTTTSTTKRKTNDRGYKFGDITKSVVKNVWGWFGW